MSEIYSRSRFSTVKSLGENKLEITTAFIDTYHEMTLHMTVAKKGDCPCMDLECYVIEGVDISMNRTPYPACKDNMKLIQNLVGMDLGGRIKGKFKERIGGSDGCAQLVELALEAFRTIIQGDFRLEDNENWNADERLEHYRKDMAGYCHAYYKD